MLFIFEDRVFNKKCSSSTSVTFECRLKAVLCVCMDQQCSDVFGHMKAKRVTACCPWLGKESGLICIGSEFLWHFDRAKSCGGVGGGRPACRNTSCTLCLLDSAGYVSLCDSRNGRHQKLRVFLMQRLCLSPSSRAFAEITHAFVVEIWT